ncbi:MAG: hypothetical protein WBD36_04940 [Bacteroidota bacterium]
MDCKEAHDQFGHAIDGILAKNFVPAFFEHLSLCRPCKKEYELELVTKSAVRAAIPQVRTPMPVHDAILLALGNEYEASTETPSLFSRMFGGSFTLPALVGGLAIAALVYFFLPSSPSPDELAVHTAANDVINQTMNNFRLIRDGELKPTMTSCYPEGVITYFEKNGVKFAVNIRPMDNCDWYGALFNEYNGVKLAHVVYKMGDELMYVYQVRCDEATDGSTLRLPPAAKTSLAKTGWYLDPQHPDCNVVLWKENGTLCVAASTMKKEKMLEIFASK